MFRRSIFLGLMIVLGSVLVYLILSARKQERRTATRPVEIIRESRPSALRVLSPHDLEIVGDRMVITRPAAGAPSEAVSTNHIVTVANRGSVDYSRIMIRFEFLSSRGRPEASRAIVFTDAIPPGSTVALPEVAIDGLPPKTAKVKAAVIWADLSDQGTPSQESATREK